MSFRGGFYAPVPLICFQSFAHHSFHFSSLALAHYTETVHTFILIMGCLLVTMVLLLQRCHVNTEHCPPEDEALIGALLAYIV